MKKIALVLSLLISLNAQAQLGLPKVFYPQVYFDQQDAQDSLKPGSSSIRGVAYYNDPMGTGTYFARGAAVILLPYSDYFAEWLNLTNKYKNSKHNVYMHPDVITYRRETTTDDYGNFSFEKLKPGKYYIETIVNYKSAALASERTGTVHTVGYGYAYSTPIYNYYSYQYAAQKKASKIIEINQPNQMVDVKLKPRGPQFIFDLDVITARTSSTSCYQQANLQYGTCKEFHKNGAVRIIADWNKSRYHGDFKEYDEQGNLLTTGKYKDDRQVGDWFYYENKSKTPTKKEQYKYIDDKIILHGEVEFYYPNGRANQVDHYVDGKLEGESVFYYDNGKVRAKIPYKAGKENGMGSYFDEQGQLTNQVMFKDGKPVR